MSTGEEPPPLEDAERIEQAVSEGFDPGEPASPDQWANAQNLATKARILKYAHDLYGIDDPLNITRGHMAGIIKELMA